MRLLRLLVLTLLAIPSAWPAAAHGPLRDRIDALTRSIAETPLDAGLYLERGELLRLDGHLDDARRDLDAAAALDPRLPRLRLCQSALAFDEGDRELALVFASSFLAHHPEDRAALELRARIHEALGKTARAAEDRAALARVQSAPRPGTTPASGAATAAATLLVPREAAWRYLATATDQAGTGWQNSGFADGGWPSGAAPLGYGESYIATTVPFGGVSSSKWITTYFRKSFTLVDDPGDVSGLVMTARYDDGFRLFVNGVEIVRRGLPAAPTTITWGTLATNHEASSYETIDLAAAIPHLVSGTNVLAVELHQQAASSSDLVWDADLTATSGTNVVRGPYLQAVGTNRATVRWRTDVATDSRVTWGLTPGMQPNAVTDPVVTTDHAVTLTGLPADTRLFYSVGSTTALLAGGDSSHSVWTAPTTPGRPTRIWVIGDSGDPAYSDEVRDGWLEYANGALPDFWMMLGDNAYNAGTDSEYQNAVFNVYPTILRGSTLWPTRGNHDALYSSPAQDYYDIFTMPAAGECGGVASGTEAYYSFNWGDIHVICLDSEGSSRAPGSAMLTWLANDLAANTKTWTIAFWHHPPYTKGSHDSDLDTDSGGRMRDMRQNALPILESAGVDLVLTGHSHSYERSCLLDQHYGYSPSLHDSMKVDGGDGAVTGDGAYLKPTPGNAAPNEGAVYAVAGASSRLGGGTLNHPVMVSSMNVLGSMELVIDGLRLDAVYVDTAGVVRDQFTIIKGEPSGVGGRPRDGALLEALPGAPNPTSGDCRLSFRLPTAGAARVDVFDAQGRLVRHLFAGDWPAGESRLTWDTRDQAGRAVAAGLYFVRLAAAGGTRTQKLVVRR